MSKASTIHFAVGCTCLIISHSDNKRAAFEDSVTVKADIQVVCPRDFRGEDNLVCAWAKFEDISLEQDSTTVQDICSDVCFASENFAKLIICF